MPGRLRPPVVDPAAAALVGEGVGDRAVAAQQSSVGQYGVRAVEQPQLALLIRGDIIDEPGVRLLPRRPPAGEVPGENPFTEWLGYHGSPVGPAGQPGGADFILGGGARGDPVHGGAHERHRVADPGGQPGIDLLGEIKHHAAEHVTVAGQVVAGNHGNGSRVRAHARPQPGHDAAWRGAQRQVVASEGREVGGHRRIAAVRVAVAVAAVARLRDGEGEHPYGWIGEVGSELGGIGAVERVGDGRDHLGLVLIRATDQQRVQPALGGEDRRGGGAATGECGDTPRVGPADLGGPPRLVRPVKRAEAEMSHAHRRGLPGSAQRCHCSLPWFAWSHGIAEMVTTVRPGRPPTG